jgi:hypothetical protein
VLLRDLELEPTSEPARKAVSLVRDRVTWGDAVHGDLEGGAGQPYGCWTGIRYKANADAAGVGMLAQVI